MKKVAFSLAIILLMLFAYGCSSTKNNTGNSARNSSARAAKGSVIDTQEALRISEEYLSLLINENYEEALKLCSEDIRNATEKERGDLKLMGFMRDKYNEAGDSLQVNYKLSLVKKGEPRADLDDLTLIVSYKDSEYKITKLNAKKEKEAYIEGNSLRQRKENEVESSPIIRLHRLPKEIYSKDNKAEYTKVAVPNKRFSAAAFGYQGDSIALASEDGSSYIAIVAIDDSLQTSNLGGGAGGGSNNNGKEGNDQGGLTNEDISTEKPIGKEINSIDVIEDSTISYLAFSEDEKYLMVEYSRGGSSFIRLYEAESGERTGEDIEGRFPEDSYQLTFKTFTKDGITFMAEAKGGNGKEESGLYSMNLKEGFINRAE